MILLGAFVLLRTVSQDATGRTLIDRILGKGGKPPAQATQLSPPGGSGTSTLQKAAAAPAPAFQAVGAIGPEATRAAGRTVHNFAAQIPTIKLPAL